MPDTPKPARGDKDWVYIDRGDGMPFRSLIPLDEISPPRRENRRRIRRPRKRPAGN